MYVYLVGLAVSNLLVMVTAIPALKYASGKKGFELFSLAYFVAHFEIPLLNSFMAASINIIICMTFFISHVFLWKIACHFPHFSFFFPK